MKNTSKISKEDKSGQVTKKKNKDKSIIELITNKTRFQIFHLLEMFHQLHLDEQKL